jgi:hypothetical protein
LGAWGEGQCKAERSLIAKGRPAALRDDFSFITEASICGFGGALINRRLSQKKKVPGHPLIIRQSYHFLYQRINKSALRSLRSLRSLRKNLRLYFD